MAKKKDERSMDEITDAILLNDEPGIDVTDDEDALIDELAALIDGDDEPIEKAAKSMFGPGKNPKSHGNTKGKGKGGLATSRTGKINRLSSGDKKQMSNWGDAADRNSEDASSARSMKREGRGYIETSRFHIAEARKALLSGDKAKATKHAYEARYSTREARQYDEGSGDRNNPGGGLRVPKEPNEKKSAPQAPKVINRYVQPSKAAEAKTHLAAARRAKTGGNLGKASYHAHEARKAMRSGRGRNHVGLDRTTGAAMHANAIGEAKFGLSFPKMKDSSMANAKKWRDKARVTKGYAPGKNPASHQKRKKGDLSNRNAQIFSGKARELINEARAAKASGDAQGATRLAHYARVHARAAKNEMHGNVPSKDERGIAVRRNVSMDVRDYLRHTASAAKAKKPGRAEESKGRANRALAYGARSASLLRGVVTNSRLSRDNSPFTKRIGKSQPGPGDVHASGAEYKKKACKCKTCRSGKGPCMEKLQKGYAVGKNPNSHKRKGTLSNRGFKGPKPSDSKLEGGSLYLYEARRSLRMARLAKDKGDKGKASSFVNDARQYMRGARRPGAEYHERNKGIKMTAGAGAHRQATVFEQDAKTLMNRARKAKAQGKNALHVQANVKDARASAREGRAFRNKSRVTKRFEIPVKIQKADKKEQIVYGWASPVSEFGTSIIDKQGDVLDIDDVRKAAHDFMLNSRSGGSMHKDIGIDKASVVESVVLSTELQKALGIDMPYEGWFIGVKIHDNAVWKKIEDGEYTGFSIGGSGVREAMEEETVEKKSMYGPGKNPNSHKRSGRAKAFESVMRGNPASPRNSAAVGKVKQHLNESKNWLDEARAVRDHDPKQAAYAAQQARKELRRARGSSTKTDSGKSLQARRARSFARQSRDERD